MAEEENSKEPTEKASETPEVATVAESAAAEEAEVAVEQPKAAAADAETPAVEARSDTIKDAATDTDSVDEPSADAAKASQGMPPNLEIAVGKETVRISTAHPMIEEIAEQLDKSRKFTLYSVASLCLALMIGILFYIVMAVQMSSRVSELDSMMSAVAKRAIQLSRGIENFSEIDMLVGESLENQQQMDMALGVAQQSLASIQTSLQQMPDIIDATMAEKFTLNEQQLVAQIERLQQENEVLRNSVQSVQRQLEQQGQLISPMGGMRRELAALKRAFTEIDDTVNDLYVIERARVAKEVLSMRPDEISDMPSVEGDSP